MSEYTKKSIYQTLTADPALSGLLGTDENGGPAVFNAHLNKLADPPFPCITFRESGGGSDPRFRETTVDQEVFDLEIWARTESALTLPAIHREVDRLLHNAELSLESGTTCDSVRLSQTPDQYDEKLNLHFGSYKYKVVVIR